MPEEITVCICTFKRPALLEALLIAVTTQNTGGLFNISLSVVDNDVNETAKPVIQHFQAVNSVPLVYSVEPVPSFALARNRVVHQAKGNFLAFIDDDELPEADWLRKMFMTLQSYDATGVLAPVLPKFEKGAPTWVVRGRFYDRPRYPTGYSLTWEQTRTGNVLIRRSAVLNLNEVFRPQFAAGGEDQDFFRRLIEVGHRFVWCDEAPVHEVVPLQRCKRAFLLRRALLRGSITAKHPKNRLRNCAKSCLAIPLYSLLLPFTLLWGQHKFMRLLVRFCDHVGRVLAIMNLNPVQSRNN